MLEKMWKKVLRRQPLSLWAIPALLFWLVSFGYRLGFWLWRVTRKEAIAVDRPVLSVGNITIGGSGKTPMVACIVSNLLAEGVRVGVVSSGYGRRGDQSIVAPGYKIQQLAAADTGDEVMLLAHQMPEAIFAVDRVKAVAAQKLAATGEVDLIVVDDGFQHLGLARDIDLVTYDAGLKSRWLKPFPYGMLREPKSALSRADIIIITRAKFARDISAIKRDLRRLNPDAQIYHAAFEAENIIGRDRKIPIKYLEDKSVYLFAGVGNFLTLERQVAALSADLDYALELSDHQLYDLKLLERIKAEADEHDSDLILTTLKDWVKLGDFDFGREFYYLDLSVDLDPGEEKLIAEIMQTLNLKKQSV